MIDTSADGRGEALEVAAAGTDHASETTLHGLDECGIATGEHRLELFCIVAYEIVCNCVGEATGEWEW